MSHACAHLAGAPVSNLWGVYAGPALLGRTGIPEGKTRDLCSTRKVATSQCGSASPLIPRLARRVWAPRGGAGDREQGKATVGRTLSTAKEERRRCVAPGAAAGHPRGDVGCGPGPPRAPQSPLGRRRGEIFRGSRWDAASRNSFDAIKLARVFFRAL